MAARKLNSMPPPLEVIMRRPIGRLSSPVQQLVRTLLKPLAGIINLILLLIPTIRLVSSRVQVEKQQMIRGIRWFMPTEPVEESIMREPLVRCLVRVWLLKTCPIVDRVLLKPFLMVVIRMPVLVRAATRSLRIREIPFLGQKMATVAFGVLVKLVSVVPLALLEAVARTTTPLLVPLLVGAARVTKCGRTRSVMLPNVEAGLPNSLSMQLLFRGPSGATCLLDYRLLQVLVTYRLSLLVAKLGSSVFSILVVTRRHDPFGREVMLIPAPFNVLEMNRLLLLVTFP